MVVVKSRKCIIGREVTCISQAAHLQRLGTEAISSNVPKILPSRCNIIRSRIRLLWRHVTDSRARLTLANLALKRDPTEGQNRTKKKSKKSKKLSNRRKLSASVDSACGRIIVSLSQLSVSSLDLLQGFLIVRVSSSSDMSQGIGKHSTTMNPYVFFSPNLGSAAVRWKPTARFNETESDRSKFKKNRERRFVWRSARTSPMRVQRIPTSIKSDMQRILDVSCCGQARAAPASSRLFFWRRIPNQATSITRGMEN